MERPAQGRQTGKFGRPAVAQNAEIAALVNAPRLRHTNEGGTVRNAD
jgi:hypothetical protein